MGAIELRFLQTKEATDASLDVFEMTLQQMDECQCRTTTRAGMKRSMASPAR